MSTDSTELTFVRCSSCRSLVPAVSTRCRMCGAALDSASEESAEQDDKSSRVRQRTMSKPKSQLSSAVQQLREELDEDTGSSASDSGTTVNDPAQSDPLGFAEPSTSMEQSADSDEADPLGFGEPTPQTSVPARTLGGSPGAERGSFAPLEDEDEERPAIDDPLSAYIQEVEEEIKKPQVAARPAQPTPREQPGALSKASQAPAETAPGERPGMELSRKPDQRPPAEAKPFRPRPSAPADAVQARQTPPTSAEVARTGAVNTGTQRRSEEHEDDGDTAPMSKSKARRSRRRRAKKRTPDSATDIAENLQSVRRREPVEQSGMKVVSSPGKKGRLFGWLVSYDDPDGDATELREGKFFVTQESLKKSDLVLSDPSISTPHAMVSISIDRGVMVQDLMSDGGVHVREKGTESYKREEEPVQIFHGDWIRFGEVEFLVTLIAHVGEK